MTRAEYERDQAELRKQELKDYKAMMIDDILDFAPGKWTREELQGKTVRTLERIYDHC